MKHLTFDRIVLFMCVFNMQLDFFINMCEEMRDGSPLMAVLWLLAMIVFIPMATILFKKEPI